LSEELKPCPFCGGDAALLPNDAPRLYRPSRNGKYAVYCGNCELLFGYDVDYGGQFGSRGEAVTAWNARKSETAASVQDWQRQEITIQPYFKGREEKCQ
jgi:hypothetical protein